MIISFYPGSGGNRYSLYQQGQTDFVLGQVYDDFLKNQKFQYRYLTDLSDLPDQPLILTHCTDTPLIKKLFPGHEIHIIKGDLKKCLLREWKLSGHDRYIDRLSLQNKISRLEHYNAIKDSAWPEINDEMSIKDLPSHIIKEIDDDYSKITSIQIANPDSIRDRLFYEIDSIFGTISYHLDYYQKYPFDPSHSTKIISIDDDNDDFAKMMHKELATYHSEIFDRIWQDLYEQKLTNIP